MKRTPELFIAVVSIGVIALTAAKLLGLVRLPAIAPLLGVGFAIFTSLMLARIRRRPGKREAKAFDANLLPMADWKLVGQEPMSALWRDRVGDAVSLTLGSAGFVSEDLSDERGLQSYCRRLAEGQGAGLVEVEAATSAEGPCPA